MVTTGQNEKWSKWKVVKIKVDKKWKLVKLKSGQNVNWFKIGSCQKEKWWQPVKMSSGLY